MTAAAGDKRFVTPVKEVWVGWISSLVEAYNMVIYSFIAPTIAPRLFTGESAWSAVFFSYALLFVGSCLLYPAGAIYYGYLGDRYGRQNLCIYSTLGLGIATGLMGLIPGAMMQDGWIYFLALIGAQYFFSGGEYHGSIVFSLEHSDQKQSGVTSALSCLFAVIGLLCANGLATAASIMQSETLVRLCFLVGAAGGVVSYVLKRYCSETPVFSSFNPDLLKEVKWPAFLKQNWRQVVSVISLLAFFIVSYTFIFIFLPLVANTGDAYDFSTFKSLIAYGVFLVLSGLIADRIGMQKTLLAGLCLFSIAILPAVAFGGDLFMIQMILTPCACLVIGPIHSWALSQFTPAERCRGIFMSSAVAMSIFGGSTVPLCMMLFESFGSLAISGIYPLAFALASLGCIRWKQGADHAHYCRD